MQHTYLRYECADAFSLTTSTSSTSTLTTSPLAFLTTNKKKNSNSNSSLLLSAAGSQIVGFNLRTNEPQIKLGHREQLSGGLGTGRALNSNHVICLATSTNKVATGWVDGTIRVFDVTNEDCDILNTKKGMRLKLGLAHSLILEHAQYHSEEEEFVTREPLLLNGHSGSPITSLAFDDNGVVNQVTTTLASGSSDGSVILWDILNGT